MTTLIHGRLHVVAFMCVRVDCGQGYEVLQPFHLASMHNGNEPAHAAFSTLPWVWEMIPSISRSLHLLESSKPDLLSLSGAQYYASVGAARVAPPLALCISHVFVCRFCLTLLGGRCITCTPTFMPTTPCCAAVTVLLIPPSCGVLQSVCGCWCRRQPQLLKALQPTESM